MSRQSTVSVVLIVRNGERYISDAIRSIGGSDLQPLEILVIDGGSTDRTREIVAGFPHVTLVPQRSQGLPSAYNEGIALARGELIGFISHDDCWLPGKLDRQVAYMQTHPEVLYTVTHVQHVLDPGTTPPPGFRAELLERPVRGFIMECLLARRECFEIVGGFDATLPVSEDTAWFARARDLNVPMAVLPDTLVHKRVHGHNASLVEPQLNRLLLRTLRESIDRKRSAPSTG